MSSNEGQDIEMLELGWATLGLPILHPCSLGLEFPTSAPFCTHHLSLGTPGHAVPLMCSFLIFSICVTRRENLYMLVSATSSSASCLLPNTQTPSNMSENDLLGRNMDKNGWMKSIQTSRSNARFQLQGNKNGHGHLWFRGSFRRRGILA